MSTESNVFDVNDNNFGKEVLKSEIPVLVDFWATWCGPCQTMNPIIKELADEFRGRIKVMKLNVDENPSTPTQYGIRGIPTLIIFKGGKVFDQIIGAIPKARLKVIIEKAISG